MVQGGGGAMYSGCGSVSGVCGVFVLVPAWCACCTSKQIVYAAQQRKAGITHTASIEAQCVFIAVTLLQQSQRQLLPQQSGTRCAVSCKMTSPCFFFRTCTIGMTALPMAASLLSWCSAKTCRKQGQKMTSTQHKHSSTQAQCSWARLDGRHGIAAQHSGLQCYTTTKCSRRHSAASRRTACSSTHLGMALRTLFKLSPTPVAVLMTCCS